MDEGSWQVTDSIQIPINGMFVMALTILITISVAYVLFWSRWGKQVRAVVQNRVMAGAVGINTEKVDRLTFGLGCGIAGIAGSAFTMIGSTGPTAGQLYIVDTFLVVVFGGAASLLGTIASAFTISQTDSTLEFFLSGSMAKVITLLAIVGILMVRPQGLFALNDRRGYSRSKSGNKKQESTVMIINSRFFNRSELTGFYRACVAADHHPAADDRRIRLNLVAKYLTLRLCRDRAGGMLGLWRNLEPGAGRVLRARWLLHGDVPEA